MAMVFGMTSMPCWVDDVTSLVGHSFHAKPLGRVGQITIDVTCYQFTNIIVVVLGFERFSLCIYYIANGNTFDSYNKLGDSKFDFDRDV